MERIMCGAVRLSNHTYLRACISTDCMDEDLEAALFQDEWDGSQAGEEFEEMDDDFVLQAGQVCDWASV